MLQLQQLQQQRNTQRRQRSDQGRHCLLSFVRVDETQRASSSRTLDLQVVTLLSSKVVLLLAFFTFLELVSFA